MAELRLPPPPPAEESGFVIPPRNRMVVPVMIEIPKGSRNKYEYDEALGRIRFDRLLCVPLTDPFWAATEELGDVPVHLLRGIEHFFAIYKDLEGKKTTVEGWDSRTAAEEVIRESRQRYQARQRRYHHP